MADKLLEVRGVSKRFPGVQALDGVDFDLLPGEVHVLLGENGAGKSTLVKILCGVYQPDSGTIRFLGKDVRLTDARDAIERGISVIHQELNLVPELDVGVNVYLGRLPIRSGGAARTFRKVDWQRVYSEARRALQTVNANIDPTAKVSRLSASERQLVEIARAVSMNARVIFMDEPTSSLSNEEIKALFKRIRALRAQGIGIVYISHKLEEIFRIGDRVTVLRDGKRVATMPVADATIDSVIEMMVGRVLADRYPKEKAEIGDVALEVKGLSRRGVLHDVNLAVRRGEILGLAGLMGSGRTEVARAIFGADPIDAGEIFLDGKKVRISSPQDAINHGIALLTEDRKNQGIFGAMSVEDNFAVSAINCERVSRRFLSRGGRLLRARIRDSANTYVKALELKTPSLSQLAQFLSGGNQQKLIVARWLCTDARVFIFDEPTRGIDVGTKAEIYKIMEGLAKKGAAIIMISSELPEILAISDRIVVMCEGRVSGELSKEEATEETVMRYAVGGIRNAS